MAVNLRLGPETERAVRARAEATGRSQQEILRAAVDAYLGRAADGAASDVDVLVAAGRLRPPRAPYRRPTARHSLPAGSSTLEALDRGDRL